MSLSRFAFSSLRSARGWHFRRLQMLGAKSQSDRSRRDSPQHWPASKLLQHPRKREPLIAAEHAADKSILYENLQALRHTGWKFAPSLNLAQCVDTNRSFAQPRGEDIRGRDRILNREVDSHPSDWRHRMR